MTGIGMDSRKAMASMGTGKLAGEQKIGRYG
jgi:hypothetical protein